MITKEKVINEVEKLYDYICCNVDKGAYDCLLKAKEKETSDLSKFALDIMTQNIDIAKNEHIAACQDTGMAVLFVEIGSCVNLDFDIKEAINIGVRQAYDKYFRKSVLSPIKRVNTKDNTPAVIHFDYIFGQDFIKISGMAKGFGSENMSRLYMLTPAEGLEGIKKAVVESVKQSGGCACPPVIVGVGVGGTMEKSALMAKHSLLREIGSKHNDKFLADLEDELEKLINETKVGAQGLGGDTTCLDVFIESYPTHIAGLPLAVNMQCHCSRHKSVIIKGDEK